MTNEHPITDRVLAVLVRGLADAVIVADHLGNIVFWNGAAQSTVRLVTRRGDRTDP